MDEIRIVLYWTDHLCGDLFFIFSTYFQITAYPTLILFSRGRQKQEYKGPRDLDSLYGFAVQHHDELQRPVLIANQSTVQTYRQPISVQLRCPVCQSEYSLDCSSANQNTAQMSRQSINIQIRCPFSQSEYSLDFLSADQICMRFSFSDLHLLLESYRLIRCAFFARLQFANLHRLAGSPLGHRLFLHACLACTFLSPFFAYTCV